ncbi:IPT/TIG domain-containing protein [Candidatus Poribacteria bacterium]
MRKSLFCVAFFTLFLIALLGFPSIGAAQVGTWTRKADMPTARWGLSTSVINGKIFAIGGSQGNLSGERLAAVEEYHPVMDIWTKKADMPTARWRPSTSVVNGRIYAIGGSLADRKALSTVEEYNPASDSWAAKADMPTPRSVVSTCVVGGKIYAIGGYDAQQGINFSAVEVYDQAADKWTEKSQMPTARGALSTSVVDGKIYAMGGYILGEGRDVSTAEVYDPKTDTWIPKAPMPRARGGHSASVVNGKIYLIGGVDESDSAFVPVVDVYDPATDTWTSGADIPTPVVHADTSAVNGRIFAIGGGYLGGAYSVVQEYDTGFRETGIHDKGPSIPWITVVESPPMEGVTTGGDPIAIFGAGFSSVINVLIGGNPVEELNVTDTLITGITPPGSEGLHKIILTTPRPDYTVFAGRFIYKTASNVTIERIAPTNGRLAGGETGSITGSGFLPGATVTIGGNQATDVGITPTLITFTIPPGIEGVKDVVVNNPDGQKGTLRNAYTYNPLPIIEELKPRYGGPLAGGTEITITGTHFMEGIVVTIGENRVSRLDSFSPTELVLRTPAGTSGPKDILVTNPDGQEAILGEGFTYNRPPRISSVEPDAGSLEGGTKITITGTRFLVGADVLVGGAEASLERVFTSSTEMFITAITPLSDAGVKDVVVINPDGQKDTLRNAFTYNTAPVITSVTPNNGRLAGGTEITIRGNGFLPDAKVFFNIGTAASKAVSSSEVVSQTTITAVMPADSSGPKNVIVRNTDGQRAVLQNGFTYNPLPTVASITPNYGSSAGGAKIIVEGTGFMQGANVVIGELPATTQVRDNTTIEAVTPSLPQGVWDVRVVNPDTQEVVTSKGFISVVEVAYNYPNPFRASQGTTFRYVTDKPVRSITVKIFNLAGVPIDVVQQMDSNEVKWHNTDVHAGLYVYVMEVELENGSMKQFRGMLEVYK